LVQKHIYKEWSLKDLIDVVIEIEDTRVERICKDAIDLFLSIKLERITKRVTLEEAISRISEKMNSESIS